jgi:RNA polymerase sigma-70 factor (ECF subfamily)
MDRQREFQRCYQAHRAAVHAYFVGRTGDRWTAADLMQEVFLRVWQRLPELTGKPADGQRAWIFAVARNLAIDTHRRERTRADTAAALLNEPPPAAPSATAAVVAAERVAVVADAIRRLPEQQRVVLAMAAAGGLTSAEIAAAVDVPADTVRYRLAMARRTLAMVLAGYDSGDQPTTEAPPADSPADSCTDSPTEEHR